MDWVDTVHQSEKTDKMKPVNTPVLSDTELSKSMQKAREEIFELRAEKAALLQKYDTGSTSVLVLNNNYKMLFMHKRCYLS